MAVKKAVKKVVVKIKEAITPEVKVVKSSAKKEECANCTSQGEQCSVCSPVFEDTFN